MQGSLQGRAAGNAKCEGLLAGRLQALPLEHEPRRLLIPCAILVQVMSTESILATRCKRTYANAHTYHINSIALSSDMETFISGALLARPLPRAAPSCFAAACAG